MSWESFALGVLAGGVCSSLAVAAAAIYLARRLQRVMAPLQPIMSMASMMGVGTSADPRVRAAATAPAAAAAWPDLENPKPGVAPATPLYQLVELAVVQGRGQLTIDLPQLGDDAAAILTVYSDIGNDEPMTEMPAAFR